mmetsp:Transcript_51338/g.94871  ORF Transcript_51338/g.94871 Transcript_51338/m.94871 type:complete len:195 (+) Transcript_51338:31-615(+)
MARPLQNSCLASDGHAGNDALYATTTGRKIGEDSFLPHLPVPRVQGGRHSAFLAGPSTDDLLPLSRVPTQGSKSSFLVVHAEQPCPTVDLSKAWMMNARLGSKCGAHQDKTCCHSVKRAKDAADRIQKMLDQNWWIVHCSAAPFDIEPLAVLVARWWRRRDRQQSDQESDGASSTASAEEDFNSSQSPKVSHCH